MSDAQPVWSQATADLVEVLNEKQRAAFESLRGGSSFLVAAEQAGVARMTVYRWVKSDPDFRAAYNAWRQEMAESAQTRLLKLADKAVDCVEHAIEHHDYGTAVTVLSRMGVMRRSGRGSIEPQIVKMQLDLEQQREKYRAAVGLMRHLLEKAGLSPEQQIEFIRQHGVDSSGLLRHEPIPQLQDDAGEQSDEGDVPDDDLADEARGEQEQEDAPDELAAVDERDVDSYPIDKMANALAEKMLQMPPGKEQKLAEPVSSAG